MSEEKTTTLTCPKCQHPNVRLLPYSMIDPDKCEACDHSFREATVPYMLRAAAKIYEERNALYGDNYKRYGHVLAVLFPDGFKQGFPESIADHHNRVGVLTQIISKLTRYCQNFDKGGHDDSLDDLAVYAMMLKEMDAEARRL